MVCVFLFIVVFCLFVFLFWVCIFRFFPSHFFLLGRGAVVFLLDFWMFFMHVCVCARTF